MALDAAVKVATPTLRKKPAQSAERARRAVYDLLSSPSNRTGLAA